MKRLLWAFFAFACVMPAYAQNIKERLTEHVHTLAADSLEGRRAATPAALKAAVYVAEQFAGIGLETYGGEDFLHPFAVGYGEGYNVIGVLEGSDRSGLTDIFPEGRISNSGGYFSVGYRF